MELMLTQFLYIMVIVQHLMYQGGIGFQLKVFQAF